MSRFKKISLLVLMVGIILLALKYFSIVPISYVFPVSMILVGAVAYMVRAMDEGNEKAIASALPSLDLVQGDMRFVGKNCKLVKEYRYDVSLEGCNVKQLCKTMNGCWFYLTFKVRGNPEPFAVRVEKIAESEARMVIEEDLKLYKEHFGNPVIA